jgi:hypothetical protein
MHAIFCSHYLRRKTANHHLFWSRNGVIPLIILVMLNLVVLLIQLLATLAKLMGPGGAKTVVADSLLMKQQLRVINRSRQRAPNFSVLDQFMLGFWSLFLSPHHILRAAVVIGCNPSCATLEAVVEMRILKKWTPK